MFFASRLPRQSLFQASKMLTSLLLASSLLACQPATEQHAADSASTSQATAAPLQIAFLPDVHFHDIYASLPAATNTPTQATVFPGPLNPHSGKIATMRTMAAQIRSTRLFNENYFALLAALDDLAARNVKLVVLPGDFSDDGQPAHVQGLAALLNDYQQRYGMQFFLTNGNHDPVKPFSRPAGKADYLHHSGFAQPVFSPGSVACPPVDQTGLATPAANHAPTSLAAYCTEQVQEWGYQELLSALAHFGFSPSANYLYWETPYSQYNSSNYTFSAAASQANINQRQYEICLQGTGDADQAADYSHCQHVPDSSYLVEPVAGLWLLAIDANVYLPDPQQAEGTAGHQAFLGSGNAGYNAMLSHKRHVIHWISDVAQRAKTAGKTLISFSHYPMTEFYQGQSPDMAALFGADRMQLNRRPTDNTAAQLAATGVGVHVGGHMHMNNTGTVYLPDGRYLINIQAPSLAGYVPAYKLLTLHTDTLEAETIVLNTIPRFNELFSHYQQEYQAAIQQGLPAPWDQRILASQNYRDFTNAHLLELTKQRFLPAEWPDSLRHLVLNTDGFTLLTLANLPNDIPLSALLNADAATQSVASAALTASPAWHTAATQATEQAKAAGFSPASLQGWQGMDLAIDFYRLRNAGQLALADIAPERLAQYRWLTGHLAMLASQHTASPEHPTLASTVQQQFGALFSLIQGFRDGAPNQHFSIDKASGKLTDLSQAADTP